MSTHFVPRAAVVALIALPLVANAAGDAKPSLKDQLGKFTADLSMPTTPAATLIGLSADNVIQPRTRREFESGIAGLFNGGSKPAGVVEFVPYYIAYGGKLSFEAYRTNSIFRAITKTSLGVATGTREVDGHEIGVTGYSLTSVLLDLADPIHSHAMQRCIDDVQAGMLARAGATAVGADPQPLPGQGSVTDFGPQDEFRDDQSVRDYQACVGRHLSTRKLWNRSRVSIGVASGSGQEKGGAKRDVRFGNTVWLSAQYGFEGLGVLGRSLMGNGYIDCETDECTRARRTSKLEQSAMLTLHFRRTRGQSNLDLAQPGDFGRTNSSMVGARFTFGNDTRSLFLESSLARNSAPGESRRTRQHAIGASFKYDENLWVNLASGRRASYLNGQLDSVVSIGIQYGAGPEPLVAAPQ